MTREILNTAIIFFSIFGIIYILISIYVKIVLKKNGYHVVIINSDFSDFKNMYLLSKKNKKFSKLFICFILSALIPVIIFITLFITLLLIHNTIWNNFDIVP